MPTRCRECGRAAQSASSNVYGQPSRGKHAGAPKVRRLRCHAIEPAVAATVAPAPIKNLEALLPKKEHRDRVIVVAVDGTDECLDGLRWLVKNTFRKGAFVSQTLPCDGKSVDVGNSLFSGCC